MKKKILIISIAVLLPLTAFAASSVMFCGVKVKSNVTVNPSPYNKYYVNNNGLVSWWPLNEGAGTVAHDWSSNGNNGTLNANTTWGAGQVGGVAASFLNSNAAITTSINSSNQLNNNISICFWIQGSSTSLSYASILANDYNFTTGYTLARNGTTTIIYLRIDNSSGTNQYGGGITNAFNGNWNQVVFTISNGTTKGYLNGALNGTGSFNVGTGLASASSSVLMGKYSSTGFIGSMEDVRIYSRALSPQEIAAMYNYENINYQ